MDEKRYNNNQSFDSLNPADVRRNHRAPDSKAEVGSWVKTVFHSRRLVQVLQSREGVVVNRRAEAYVDSTMDLSDTRAT
ncbi:hypothetical protein PGT21_001247 [Puccinia graminis f. sp. tritici]|uniref:Uncharacterized protein n=1 Tax=Puccinia graminis f. sp. tritici TaxID=56615 RepID=A0A5B0LTD2_PUCGR|nr:hypothetical protein PGT21_001247 [Puccinia graminis f. sp. tritici]KAA1132939.1 hypothetical protein PGTUg99_005077 [Puccinia graminis f. sp. tritici]